ncbi:hypothetical protein THOM_2672 [Trachipleistophora hominis]|uniref:Uncharacterized protein n=1 Tax=Trachipleistophora hominis TaxID=72359 RepID=L7JTM5_TRAHO|nr:hypothetical protein THOM_2672 [Trachipleistophora hominis]
MFRNMSAMFIPLAFFTILLTTACNISSEASIEAASVKITDSNTSTTEKNKGEQEENQTTVSSEAHDEDKCSGFMTCDGTVGCNALSYADDDDDASSTGDMYVISYGNDELYKGDTEFDMDAFLNELEHFPFNKVVDKGLEKKNDEKQDVEKHDLQSQVEGETESNKNFESNNAPQKYFKSKAVQGHEEALIHEVVTKPEEQPENVVEKAQESESKEKNTTETNIKHEEAQESNDKHGVIAESKEAQPESEAKTVPEHDVKQTSEKETAADEEHKPTLEVNPATEPQEKQSDKQVTHNAESPASGSNNVVLPMPEIVDNNVEAKTADSKLVITPELTSRIVLGIYNSSEEMKKFGQRLEKKDKQYTEKAMTLLNTFLRGLEELEDEAQSTV